MSNSRSLVSLVEERLLVPTYTSRWGRAPVLAHRSMALPLQLIGHVRRRQVQVGGQSVSLIEVGREKLLRSIGSRVLGELPPPVRQMRRALWSPEAVTEGAVADIVLAQVHRWMAPRFRRAGWLIVPQSVRWQGELAALPPKGCSHGLRENLRKMRRQNFELTQAGSDGDWQEFFDTMVRPQALARHGAGAWIPSQQLMDEFSRIGMLHFITRQGERLAGICTVSRGDTVWGAVSGVRQGDPSLMRQHAGFAVFALTIEWARAQGYRFFDAGRTGPFIHDGVQQFKRGWGLSPFPDPLSHVAAIWVGSDVVRQAFAREPVLTENGADLRVYTGE
ncbi:MAG: GNAT family N-acetyltransferase [Gemmatimonadales bacterium]